jgi:hypothetical protein
MRPLGAVPATELLGKSVSIEGGYLRFIKNITIMTL